VFLSSMSTSYCLSFIDFDIDAALHQAPTLIGCYLLKNRSCPLRFRFAPLTVKSLCLSAAEK
jgi:hypothetical protein